MSPLITTLLIVTGALALAFRRSALTTWTAFGFGVMALIHLLGTGLSWFTWGVFVVVAVILNVRPLRRRLLSAHLLRWFRNVLPPMSATEKEAIDAGTVWWDAELFSGRPDWRRLLDTPSPELTAEEKAFLDGPTAELCRMLDDWKIENETGDLPPE
ncbi:MAG: acyl-CoA dehydrogenase, partial [Gammaproteobacteria bacterium]